MIEIEKVKGVDEKCFKSLSTGIYSKFKILMKPPQYPFVHKFPFHLIP